MQTKCTLVTTYIDDMQGDAERNSRIFGSDSIGHRGIKKFV
jgi:hypothetical protein